MVWEDIGFTERQIEYRALQSAKSVSQIYVCEIYKPSEVPKVHFNIVGFSKRLKLLLRSVQRLSLF